MPNIKTAPIPAFSPLEISGIPRLHRGQVYLPSLINRAFYCLYPGKAVYEGAYYAVPMLESGDMDVKADPVLNPVKNDEADRTLLLLRGLDIKKVAENGPRHVRLMSVGARSSDGGSSPTHAHFNFSAVQMHRVQVLAYEATRLGLLQCSIPFSGCVFSDSFAAKTRASVKAPVQQLCVTQDSFWVRGVMSGGEVSFESEKLNIATCSVLFGAVIEG